jgi:hypothetical protein
MSSRLHSRITGQAAAARAAADGYHPYGTPDTPMTMPMTAVFLGGAGAMVEQMTGLVTANGAVIPATMPGRYGQVYLTPRPGQLPSPSLQR